MDVRQLEAFLAVVDHGSFSAAAKALFTVQSNVSTHVARLEDEVGATLLDRRTRRLTIAGEAVEARARVALSQIASIADDIASLDNRVIGAVKCGTTPSVGLWVLPGTLAETTKDYPEIAVTVVEAASNVLMQLLLTGDLDLAITTHAEGSDVLYEPLFDEEIVAVLSTDHPLAGATDVTLDDLSSETLLLPLHDNPLYGHIEQAFERADIALRAGLEVGSSALVSAMAAAGLGVALVPATAAETPGVLDVTRQPVVDLAPREVALTSRAGQDPPAAVLAIAEIVTRIARNAAASMPGCRVRTDSSHNRPNHADHVLGMER